MPTLVPICALQGHQCWRSFRFLPFVRRVQASRTGWRGRWLCHVSSRWEMQRQSLYWGLLWNTLTRFYSCPYSPVWQSFTQVGQGFQGFQGFQGSTNEVWQFWLLSMGSFTFLQVFPICLVLHKSTFVLTMPRYASSKRCKPTRGSCFFQNSLPKEGHNCCRPGNLKLMYLSNFGPEWSIVSPCLATILVHCDTLRSRSDCSWFFIGIVPSRDVYWTLQQGRRPTKTADGKSQNLILTRKCLCAKAPLI